MTPSNNLSSLTPSLPGVSESSPNKPTKLLQLPDEILYRIIQFTIPPPTVCPFPPSLNPVQNGVGLTCTRLFKLVKRRLHTLDFLRPASPVTHISRISRMSYETVEAFTRLASPFVEVLHLPSDFKPQTSDMSTMGCCPHLTTLSIPLTREFSRRGVENFLIPLKKLQVLTVHNPRTPIFELFTNPSWKLRELSIISLHSTHANLKILKQLLSNMHSLESFTVTFYCPGRYRVLNSINSQEPYLALSFPEALEAVTEILQEHAKVLKALRKLSVSTYCRSPGSRVMMGPGENVNRMVGEIDALREIVHRARFDTNPRYLKLEQLDLYGYVGGEEDLGNFMKGLVDSSTDVEVRFETVTVAYPAAVMENVSPVPVCKGITFFFEEDYWALKKSMDFRPRSVSILTKRCAESLTTNISQAFLSVAMHGSIESIRVEYLVETREELRVMMKVLHYITNFTPAVELLALPVSLVPNSDMVTLEDFKKIKCSDKVRVLWLDFNASETYQTDPRGTLYLADDSIDFYRAHCDTFLERLPNFLHKVRCAFPKLEMLYLERTQIIVNLDDEKVRMAERAIEAFERVTHVDASSLRQELRRWSKLEKP